MLSRSRRRIERFGSEVPPVQCACDPGYSRSARRSLARSSYNRRCGGCGPLRHPDPAPAVRARLAPGLFVAALLVATSVAFAVTEKLKLTRNPIVAPVVDKTFAPTCDCATAAASIRFGLRRPDRVDLEIVDDDGDVVRELARSRRQGRPPVTYLWDGRDDDRSPRRRRRLPASRSSRHRERRTIVMYNRIRVDTAPPRSSSFTARPWCVSPDGDGRSDRAKIRYRVGGARPVDPLRRRHPRHYAAWGRGTSRARGLVRRRRRERLARGPAHASPGRARRCAQPRRALGSATVRIHSSR